MKKRLALAAAFAFSIIPFTSFANNLEPDENQIKKGGELVSTKLEDYDLFSNNLSDDILIALRVNGYEIKAYADLSGADLSGADLSGADLFQINLSGANLQGADLSDAELTYANLSNANLQGADLSDANLRAAILSGADLSDANLFLAYLRLADLSGADLSGADLSDNGRGKDLLGADLSDANLEYANLQGSYLKNADLSDANLRAANLSDVYFIDANLSGANLSGANLNDADLSGVDLSGADLTDVIAENLIGCPSALPTGWVCEDNSLIPPEPEFFTFKPFLVNKKVKVFNNSLPYQIECFDGEFLKISLSDNGKFLVQLDEKNKFDGFDFKKAGKKFKKTYKKCSFPTTQPDGSPWPTKLPNQ